MTVRVVLVDDEELVRTGLVRRDDERGVRHDQPEPLAGHRVEQVAPLLGRVRHRIGDKRILGWVKAFLRAGVLTEEGVNRETTTGTPQGGIFTPPTQWATSASR